MSVIDSIANIQRQKPPPVSTWNSRASNVPKRATGREMAKKTVVKRKTGLRKATPKKSTIKSTGRKSAGAKSQTKPVSRKSPKARPPKGPIWQWSAVETAAAIGSGAISSIEIVEAHIERMRDVNPRLNAVVVDLSEEALRAAKAADKRRRQRRRTRPAARRAGHDQGKRR